MHLVLTDRLTCPRCGPQFGLILLAERLEDRRVLDGALGCPNCRDRYPITGGFGDLRPAPRAAWPVDDAAALGDDAAVLGDEMTPAAAEGAALDGGGEASGSDSRDGALLLELLGAARGAGQVAVVGAAASRLPALRQAADPELELVVVGSALRSQPERAGVSRLAAGPTLPFFDRSMRGVLLSGAELSPQRAAEAARVVAARHRVVVIDAGPECEAWLRGAGLPEVHMQGRLAAGAR